MSKPITKLTLTKFRGATQSFEIDFDPAKDITLLYGENGTGKSSIVDGIDAVCNESIGSIANISIGTRSTRYIPTMGATVCEVGAAVFYEDEQWSASVTNSRIQTTGSADRPIVAILRRNEILNLVVAPPAERYKELQRFIDVGGVQESEMTLQRAAEAVDSDLHSAADQISNFELQLEELWCAEGNAGESGKVWAEEIVGRDVSDIMIQKKLYERAVRLIDSLVDAKDDHEVVYRELQTSVETLESVQGEIEEQPAVEPRQAIRLVDALAKVKEFVDADESLEACPVCKQPVTHVALAETIDVELGGMTELKELNTRLKAADRDHSANLKSVEGKVRALQVSAKLLSEDDCISSIGEFAEVALNWPEWTDVGNDIRYAEIITVSYSVSGIRDNINTEAEKLSTQVNQYNALKILIDGITKEEEKAETASRLKAGLEDALGVVRNKRHEYTQAVLDGIVDEANRMYQVVHPGESIGLSKLEMETTRRASVSQKGNFHGHDDVPPQALLSESHMDTLGFCVWLALVKKEKPEDTVLVIDDVFTSVDSVHLTRVVELLSDECENFRQVIVTTHYLNWWQRYGGGATAARNVERIKLARWTFEHGMVCRRQPLDTEELKALLEETQFPECQSIASKAGILLEKTLDQVTEQFSCRVARNLNNEYTLGILMDSSSSLFRKHLRVTMLQERDGGEIWTEIEMTEKFQRVKDITFIRNQVGCHFNLTGLEVADADVINFGRATLELVEGIACPNCGMLPARPLPDKTGYRCKCNSMRLNPFTA